LAGAFTTYATPPVPKTIKLLSKETEEDTKGWKDLSSSLTARINIMKMAILLNAIYRSNAISPQNAHVIYLQK
jgi:hypothetical protein